MGGQILGLDQVQQTTQTRPFSTSNQRRAAMHTHNWHERPFLDSDEYNNHIQEVPYYHPGKRVDPPLFPSHKDEKSRKHLDLCLKRDIAWSMVGALKSNDEELPLLGSWTPFNREVTDHLTTACIEEFLPVTPHPSEYPICKEYLDFIESS